MWWSYKTKRYNECATSIKRCETHTHFNNNYDNDNNNNDKSILIAKITHSSKSSGVKGIVQGQFLLTQP